MRVVSSQSEEEIRRRETTEALTAPLRELAANVMRLSKGGGHPLYLLEQLEMCAAAIRGYVAAHGHLPHNQLIRDILDCDLAFEQHRPWLAERRQEIAAIDGRDFGSSDREEAMRLIRDGALQLAASILVNQIPQQAMGRRDITAGVRLLETARAKAMAHRPKAKEVLAWLSKMKSGSARGNRKKRPGS